MGACLDRNNKTTIIKVRENYKEKKMLTNKINNKTRATLTSSEFEIPQCDEHQISLSIHSLCSYSLSNEINITDIQSSYNNINNNSFIQEISEIIYI